jgi:hypothetical protein
LEWFFKSLLPYISKVVSTFGVTYEEDVIFKSQQLDLIYAQFWILYEILPNTSRSNYNPRQNPGPHGDDIIGLKNVKYIDLVTGHLKELYLSYSIGGQASSVSYTPTQLTEIHSMQSSTKPNRNQQPGGNKSKGRVKNHKGGRNNDNKPKDDANNDRLKVNAGEGNKEKRKVKFPYNICIDDNLTHLCPKLEEAARLLSLPPTVLANPFFHNQHMTSSSSNSINSMIGSQKPPTHDSGRLCINMVKSQINVATRSHDYSSSHVVLGLESPPPPETPLQIENLEPLPCIPKGVLKFSTHNPNARASQNYSIVEDLGQTPCAMLDLEVL